MYMVQTMNNEQCKNPKACKEKHTRWGKRNSDLYIEQAQEKIETYLTEIGTVNLSNHYRQRSFERVVSSSDILNVLKNGWVIESSDNSVIVLGYSKYGLVYRPFHVVLAKKTFHNWKIKTVYCPESHGWKWNEGFDERVCFCKIEEGEY